VAQELHQLLQHVDEIASRPAHRRSASQRSNRSPTGSLAPQSRSRSRPRQARPPVHSLTDADLQDYDQMVALENVVVGLSPSLLRQLEASSFRFSPTSSTPSSRGSENTHECPICLSAFAVGDHVLALPCLHVFHCDCVVPWLRRSKLCPVCKRDVAELAE
jgi:hypothetical protein